MSAIAAILIVSPLTLGVDHLSLTIDNRLQVTSVLVTPVLGVDEEGLRVEQRAAECFGLLRVLPVLTGFVKEPDHEVLR